MATARKEVKEVKEANDRTSAERDLVAWLEWKEQNSLNTTDDDISESRREAYDIYHGEPYGDEEEGYSKAITREVMESIEWAMPGLLRTFLHSPRICTFLPQGADDVEAAKQETAICNYDIMTHQDAWETLNAWFRDALMYPNGYAKIWWNDIEDSRLEFHKGQTGIQIALLEQEEDVEVIEVSQSPGQQDLMDVVVRYDDVRSDLQISAVPPEEVLVDNEASKLNLDKSQWVCHSSSPTRGEIFQMGYDEDTVEQLPKVSMNKYGTEKTNRAKFLDEDPNTVDDGSAVNMEDERVDWFECYGYVDFNSDGRPEYRKMVHSGSFLMENEETTYQPLCALGTIPQSHRHVCMSMVDLSKDIQRINTVQTRQMLDNLYRTNRPRQFAGRGVNLDQLMSYAPFGVVEMNDPKDVQTESIPSVIQSVLPAIDSQRSNLEMRTGMSRMMQGMDADKLAKTTMGAYFEALGMANQRLEYVVRCFAETGMKQMIQKAHHLRRLNPGSQKKAMQLRGKWVDINPAEWKERTSIIASVGLGTGTQRERLSSSMALLDLQEKAMAVGLTTPSRIFQSLEDISMAMGKTTTDMYFLDPDSDEGKEVKDKAEKAKQQAKQEEQKQIQAVIQAEVEPKMAKIQADLQINNKRLIQEMMKLRASIEKTSLEHDEAIMEMELKNQVDIQGEGVKKGQVTPLRVGGG